MFEHMRVPVQICYHFCKLFRSNSYKDRIFKQELKEQHELLYETKLVLEEQVTSNSTKIERVGKKI